MGGAIAGALQLIEAGGFGRARRVIDISGNGSNNNGPPPELVREGALESGATINGLANLSDEILLDRYFEAKVMGGPGAFVIAIESASGITEALVQKLVREIAGTGEPAGPRRMASARSGGGFPLAGQAPSD